MSVITFSKDLFPSLNSMEVFFAFFTQMNALFAQNMVENIYMHEHKFNGDSSSKHKVALLC